MSKIIREKEHAFVIGSGCAYGFNLKNIAKVTVEDCDKWAYGAKGNVFVQVWTGGEHPTSMEISYAEARQLFQDTPWMLAIPKEPTS